MTEQFKYVKELLNTATGSQGTLLIPRKIYSVLVPEVQKALIGTTELAAYNLGPGDIPGSSVDINLQTVDSANARLVAEGTEYHLDTPGYQTVNIKPLKYGLAVKITGEIKEDSQFTLLQNSIAYAGKKMAENENSLLITTLDGAANTVSGGAQVTIANLTRAMQYLNDADFDGTDLLVGMEVLNDLQNIDTFAEANKFGTREMLERGMVGTVYGLNVRKVSTNAGMTTTSAYVLDRSQAYARVEKRPVTVENFTLPISDMEGAVVSQRIAFALLRSSAVAKITSS